MNDVVGVVTGVEIRVGVQKRLIIVVSEIVHASAFPERRRPDSLRNSDAEQHDAAAAAAAAAGGTGSTLGAGAGVVAVVSAQRTHSRHRR